MRTRLLPQSIRSFLSPWSHYLKNWRKPRVFVLSFQRTGTKSQGQFLRELGFPVASWRTCRRNAWEITALAGNYEKILKSRDFLLNKGFEDDPWWHPDLYKYLYWRLPKARFIFLSRDPDDWFDSMLRHSPGRVLGFTHLHCTIYRRLEEFEKVREETGLFDASVWNGLPLEERHREGYIKVYQDYQRELRNFVEYVDPGRERFFLGRLEDPGVWNEMARFLGQGVQEKLHFHVHRSKT